MTFTAYAQMRLPQVSQEFGRLGFTASSFRLELSWAKLAGVVALLLPIVPSWVKEWAYAGFAITLASALIAHISIGEGANAWGWAAGTAVLWALSFFFWRRIQARRANESA
jgi:DoxX-like family